MIEMEELDLFDEGRLLLALEGLLLGLEPEVRSSLVPGLDLLPGPEEGWFTVVGRDADGMTVEVGSFDRIILLKGGPGDIGTN
jgi:hypothetical protein